MVVVVGADSSAEGLMEALIGGTDQPPFLQEFSAGFVGHAIATAVNSAGKPVQTTGSQTFTKVNHGLLLPPSAGMSPFPVDVEVRVLVECLQDELLGVLEHFAFSTSGCFKDFSTFRGVVVQVGELTPLGTWEGEPNALGSVSSP